MTTSTAGYLPSISLEGDFETMGMEHGGLLGPVISELSEVRYDLLCRIHGRGAAEEIQLVAGAMIHAIKQYTPNVYRETLATALSAGVPYWRLVVAGAFSDLSDVVAKRLGKANRNQINNECTLTILQGSYGRVIVGTWDSHASAQPSLVVCRRKPSSGPETLALTTAGWPMQQGITSAKVAFAIANLVSSTSGMGVPYIAALPAICQSGDVKQALRTLQETPHASARFYALCSPDTQYGVEVVPGVSEIVSSTIPTSHTNHFIYEDALAYEGRPYSTNNSRLRLTQAQTYIETSKACDDVITLLRSFASIEAIQTGTGDDDNTNAIFALVPQTASLYYLGYRHQNVSTGDVARVSLEDRTKGEAHADGSHSG